MTTENRNHLVEEVRQLSQRFERVERAILGDPSVGHAGLVDRVGVLESNHIEIERLRVEGDRRSHQRIDDLADQTRDRLDSIEHKLDRAIWLTAGAFMGGGLIGGGSVWAVLTGM